MRTSLKPYVLAVASTAAAIAMTRALWPANRSVIVALYYLAVLVSDVYGSRRAAMLTIGLSALSIYFLFLSPFSLRLPTSEHAYVLTIFFLVSGVITLLMERTKAKERRVREREELFRVAFHSNPVGMAISRASDGHYVEANDTFELLTGYSREQIIGRSAIDLGLASHEQRARYIRELSENGLFHDQVFVMPVHGDGERQVRVSVERVILQEQPHFVGIFEDITARTRNEDTMREQAELLNTAQRIGRMGTWSLDVGTGRLAWPDATCHLFGIAPSAFTETFEQFHSFILPEDVSAYDALNARLSLSEPLFEAEYRIRRPDGVVRWLLSRGRLEADAAGAPMRRIGVVMDITDQHVAQEQLAESAALLRIAGRVARLGGWTIQLPSRTLTWSDENCAIHDVPPGYKPTLEEGIGYYPADYRADVVRHVETCERDGTPYDFELPKTTATGRRIWVRSIGEAVRDADGQIVRLQGAFQDISSRKHAEEEMRQKDALIRIAGRVTHTGGWAMEVAGRRMTGSDEVFDIFDYTRGHAPSLDDAMALFLKSSRSVLVEAMETCCRDGTPFDLEAEALTTTGQRKWVRVTAEAERDADGAICRMQGAMQDITDRKQLEQQSLRTQRMESIGTLAAGIAHDLNNMLAPILLSIGLLQQDELDADRLATLATIKSSAQRGAAMIGRVLSFARGMDGQRVEVHLTPLIRDLAMIVRDTFPKNIAFEDYISPDLWTLQADPTQLHQVLLNLCVNARDAMPAGGHITITAENVVLDDRYAAINTSAWSGTYVTITVHDTGTGIPNEIIDRIFDPFFTTKETGEGTGLGLATAFAIVTGHRGFMRVTSDPGTGARFQLYLPALTAPATLPSKPAPSVILPRGTGETVLVVDDEAGIRQIAQRTLEKFGYRTLMANDGAEAVALYVRHQADIAVVLTDIMMPVMNGTATIQELVRVNPQVRIIAASGLVTDAKVAGAAGARVLHFLAKPYTAEALLTAIRAALT